MLELIPHAHSSEFITIEGNRSSKEDKVVK